MFKSRFDGESGFKTTYSLICLLVPVATRRHVSPMCERLDVGMVQQAMEGLTQHVPLVSDDSLQAASLHPFVASKRGPPIENRPKVELVCLFELCQQQEHA